MLRNGFHSLLLRCSSLRNFHLFVWSEKRQVYCTPGYCNVSNNPQQAHHNTFRGFWSIFKRTSLSRLTVAMFHSKVNPTTGKLEWCAPEEGNSDLQEDSDIFKELFRSQYGDMLHDTERNEKFYSGVRYTVQKAREMGVEPDVLDIGTGTGLLSLMAAKCGVKKITACEALKPMAKVAKDIVHKNGYQDVITMLPKRSTEMTVGVDVDMKDRANIVVTEMFDTELIGEAALSTFLHAHQQLLQKGSIVVPQTAMVLVQPVSSTFLHSSHSIHPHMCMVGEPFFFASLLPWHNLVFWYASTKSKALLKDGGKILPCVIGGVADNNLT